MAETSQSTSPAYILAGEQHARQQLAADMAVRNADPLDEAKREGGFYMTDSGPVDAQGNEIDADDLSGDEKDAVKAHADRIAANQPRRPAPAAKAKKK